MIYTFKITSDGMDFIKQHKLYLYPNVTLDEGLLKVSLDLPKPDKGTHEGFMSEIKSKGLLIGKKYVSDFVVLNSQEILEYPLED